MAAAPLLGLAATALSAGSAIMGGVAKARGDAVNAQNAQNAAEYGKLQAQQTGYAMQSQLAGTLANISAVRATTNTAGDSPTMAAITSGVEGRAADNQSAKMAGINAQVKSDEASARNFTNSTSFDLLGGILGGVGAGLGGAYSVAGGKSLKNPFSWSAVP